MNAIYGMPIVQSALALETTNVPVRVHKQRRCMSASYHRRVQKKWTKRFGYVKQPCMWKVSPRAAGLTGQDYFVVHPSLMPKIKAAMTSRSGK